MTGWSRNGGARLLVVMTTGALAALIFVACGGSSGSQAADRTTTIPPTTTTAPLPDVAPTAADFVNINTMKRVGDHFIGSLNGHLDAALAVARKPEGGVYPVGTVLKISSSGAKVKNFLGGDCASCHVAARKNFDFVCGKGHGCAPLGVTDALIATIQKGDPRPKR